MKLHAALRMFAYGEMEPEHLTAFVDASLKRERMMAHVLSYLAEQRKQRAMNKRQFVSLAREGSERFTASPQYFQDEEAEIHLRADPPTSGNGRPKT
jgi:hypothetical protein